MQQHFELIPHLVEREIVQQRVKDGYINATAMCQATGKLFGHYRERAATREFLEALSVDIGMPISELVQSFKGGDRTMQGTWVHPDVAVNLAQWCSPQFAVQVARWVREWMSGKAQRGMAALPYHLQRYLVNEAVPAGYFSVLSELSILLIAPLERMGYRLPPELVPDISEGRMYCRWLREEKNIDTDKLPTYWHSYLDGRRVRSKLYPDDLLADFRRHVRDVWIPQCAADYFRKRDPKALQYLPKLLPPKAA